MPSVIPQFAGPPGGDDAHVPSICPAATVQAPVQQLAAVEHASPGCPQNEEGAHAPPLHRPEQHAASDVHVLPRVEHAAFRAAQWPVTQLWLQQSPFVEHAPLSLVHAG
jgi:hypothetical protein